MAYIEKEKVQVFLRTECLAKYPASFANGLLAAADILKKIPAADVVEVVRCRDCAYWDGTGTTGRCESPRNGLFYEYTDDFDYCSYGKRREKE